MTTHQDPTDPAPFSDDELDELDRLDKAATPVPLEYHASEMLILPSPSAMTGGKRSGWCGEASSAAEGLALVSARNALHRLVSGYRALREENGRLRAMITDLCNRLVCSHPVGMTCIACDARALLEDSAK